MSRLLLGLALAATATAAWLHFHSPLCRALRAGEQLQLVYLGRAPALAAYEPANRKLTIVVGRSYKFLTAAPAEQALELSAALAPSPGTAPVLRYIHAGTSQDGRTLWNGTRELVTSWHSNPALIKQLATAYRLALSSGTTDIAPYEFAALSLEMVKIGPLDLCALKEDTKKNSAYEEPQAQQAATSAPLKIEILNASGRKGQAVTLTRHLRELAAAGELNVDVLSHDNYARREKKSRFISRSGRIDELKALGARLGLGAVEITAAPEQPGQLDASLIMGEDLVLPARR